MIKWWWSYFKYRFNLHRDQLEIWYYDQWEKLFESVGHFGPTGYILDGWIWNPWWCREYPWCSNPEKKILWRTRRR
jgi:hypothetical protein